MTAPARAGALVPIRSRRLPRVLAVTAVVAAAAASFLASSVPAEATGSRYVKAVPVCKTAATQHASCYAMKLVPAKAGEAGARAVAASQAGKTSLYGPAGGYTPAALAAAYGVNRTAATTQIVGIVDAFSDPNVKPDLNKFDAQYGFPAETASSFRVVNQRGAASPLPTANASWAGEISLDVDSVRGMCAKCKIILVEADSNSFADLATAENQAVTLGATVVSNSFGAAESGGTPSASYLAAFNHPGVVITASTADAGFYDWDNLNKGGSSSNSPATPAAFTSVVAVGGTTLNLDNTGARANESVWNSDGPYDFYGDQQQRALGASGGGCSTLYKVPAWQKNVAGYASTGCGTKRMVGDVAALADPFTGYDVYDSYQTTTSWGTFGGTSLASPLVAGMWALAGGSGGVDYPAKNLYANFAAGASTYDVRVGGNGACGGVSAASCAGYFGGSPNSIGRGVLDCAWTATGAVAAQNGQCYAKVGYDGPSGVGTPNGLAIFAP